MPLPTAEEPEPVSVAALELLPQRPEVLAARADVRAARLGLEEELERMEAALRSAVDIKAKIRRNPVKVAAAAAGTGFLVVGGPRRVIRGARNAIFGKPSPLPKAMLPDEIEQAVKALGDDGDKVRGALERNFARYLEQNAPERKGRDWRSQLLFLGLPTARVLILRFGRQFIEQVLSSEAGFEDQLARVRARRGQGTDASGEPPPPIA